MDEMQDIIINALATDEAYTRAALPFLKSEYFDPEYSLVFDELKNYIQRFNNIPSKAELIISVKSKTGISQSVFESAVDIVNRCLSDTKTAKSEEWLISNTESFCKDKALYNAVLSVVGIMNEPDTPKTKIHTIISDALSISFDSNIGMEMASFEDRWSARHVFSKRVEFDIDILNYITAGGLPEKTLSVISALAGAGKTLFMCHVAARAYLAGKNVLYITLEMSEDEITQRIETNLLDIELDSLQKISKQEYTSKMEKLVSRTKGRFFVKEYGNSTAGVGHFKALINDLKLKQNFDPDLVIVDYLNICVSARCKYGAVNSYTWVKSICEEVRALAIELKKPFLSATQLNRGAVDTSDVGMGEISESHGLVATVDALWAMIRTEELDDLNQVMFKQIKNRFTDMAKMLRFVLGINRSKMQLFSTDSPAKIVGDKIETNGSPEVFYPPKNKSKPERKFGGLTT